MTQQKSMIRVGVIGAVAVALLAVMTGGAAAAPNPADFTINETTDPVGEPFNAYGNAEIAVDHPESYEFGFGSLSVVSQDGTEVTVSTYSGSDSTSDLQLDGSDLETAFGGSDSITLDVKDNSTTLATATMEIEDPTTTPVQTDKNQSGAPINDSSAGIEWSVDGIDADKSLVTVEHDGIELSSSDINYIGDGSEIFVEISDSEIDEEVGSQIGSTADYTLIYNGTTLGTTTIERVDPMVETVEIDKNTTQLNETTVNISVDESELSNESSLVWDDQISIRIENRSTGEIVSEPVLLRSSNETTTFELPGDDDRGYWSQDLQFRSAENLTLYVPDSGVESVEIGSETVYQSDELLGGGGGGGSSNNQLIMLVLVGGAAAALALRD